MPSPVAVVRAQQQAWAKAQDIPTDAAGYTLRLDDNLFVALSDKSVGDFKSGDGAELGDGLTPGKMQALRSSSALACNVFEYWRQRDPAPLANALALTRSISTIRFEQKFPTGLRGNAPNLDVVLGLESGHIAIESKFLEPYEKHTAGFRSTYFDGDRTYWEERGLKHCQELAHRIQDGRQNFKWLDAEQLLKHALGLAKCGGEWSLWYLWYEVDDVPGTEHAAEAEEFGTLANMDGIGFRSMTYQDLFARLYKFGARDHRRYLDYLADRYFA
jgi:hypothetical protein